jgi:hypothetical protein
MTARYDVSYPPISVVDPNPKESELIGWIRSEKKVGFGFGFGSRHCCKIKNFVKNRKSNT